MNSTKKEYDSLTKQASPPSPKLKNSAFAFVIGGLVCAFGQALFNLYSSLGLEEQSAKTLVSVTLIGITALLTAAHVYDKYARVAGAGSLVPITGFANAVASPAIEFKAEGQILGIGVKMFSVAGPVIVYGVGASVLYGIILWIVSLFNGGAL